MTAYCPYSGIFKTTYWTYDNFSLVGLVDGLYAVGRENFWVKFSIKNIDPTILFELSILFILKHIIVWSIKENKGRWATLRSRKSQPRWRGEEKHQATLQISAKDWNTIGSRYRSRTQVLPQIAGCNGNASVNDGLRHYFTLTFGISLHLVV